MDAEQQVADAQRAVTPWWRISLIGAAAQVALSVVALVLVLTQQAGDGMLIDGPGFLVLSAATVTPFAVAAIAASSLALLLISRKGAAGAMLLTGYGVAVGAVLAQWVLVLLNPHAPQVGTSLLVGSFVVGLGAVAAAVIGAATLGRTLRVSRAQRAIGVREF